jgi:hypothetical protein
VASLDTMSPSCCSAAWNCGLAMMMAGTWRRRKGSPHLRGERRRVELRYTALHSPTQPYTALHSPTQPYTALQRVVRVALWRHH